MVALCHGGEHSLSNIVIVCRPCNARKASLTYEQWIRRVEPEHRVRVQRLWIARHPHSDRALPLFAAYAGLAHLSGGLRCDTGNSMPNANDKRNRGTCLGRTSAGGPFAQSL